MSERVWMGEYRYKAIEHYGDECQHCGYKPRKNRLHVHHIDKNRDNNELKNLMPLCTSCHRAADSSDGPPYLPPDGFEPEHNGTVWVKFEVSDETHRAMKVEAAQTDRTMDAIAADIIEARYAESDDDTDGNNPS